MIYDVIVVGAGPAGIFASISAAKDGKNVLLVEKMPQIALKLKATGGGKCNLTNTLKEDEFCEKFGRSGRFIKDALEFFSKDDLLNFFASIGVETVAKDGFRIFPVNHKSTLIIEALEKELKRLDVDIKTSVNIEKISKIDGVFNIESKLDILKSKNLILATGGLGYPTLGATGDGYSFASIFGHTITKTYPAMMPLFTKEKNFASCKADTISKAILKVDLKKHKNLKLSGDLIFTNNGLRGPVILDFARQITPILEEYDEVPLLISFLKGRNEDEIFRYLKDEIERNPTNTILQNIETLLATNVAKEILNICDIEFDLKFKQIEGQKREKLVKTLAWTPFNIVGHDGFKQAMITRGGVDLKQINSKTMQSKLIDGLYFCGELVDIDGPCGGYNLQWSFSSGFLSGKLKK